MPLEPSYTTRFESDLKRMLRRGKDPAKIKEVITRLIRRELLDSKNRDHRLIGNYKGRRDCHIEPDRILIYKLELERGRIIFERTGTHSDLYR